MAQYFLLFKLFLKRLMIVFVIYQLCRFLFLLFNYETFQNLTLKTFLGGAVFDLSAIGFINLLFVFLHLLPGKFKYGKGYQKGLKIFFFTVNMIFIATNFVDFEYYKFTGKRSSFGLITAKGMENEIAGLIPTFLAQFWYLPILFTVFAILIWKIFGRMKKSSEFETLDRKTILKQTGILLLTFAITFLCARGGFQSKPLRIVDAINYSSLGNSALVLNTPFCILKTMKSNDIPSNEKYFAEDKLNQVFNPVIRFKPSEKPLNKNVVIIILESFGNENIKKGYTPFLDSLLTKSLYFKNGFANGKVSIDAVPSILSSIPSLMNSPFISTQYSVNKVYSLPKIFRHHGYNTSFFHGAFNGSQNFDQYCKVAGFEKYYGKNEYPIDDKTHFDGKWGIFDEPFLQFFCDEIGTFKQPFFTSIFTISSHQPFILPEQYIGKFNKGTTPVHETVGYSDNALRQFFNKAKKQKWYNNTVFVLTADHTSPFVSGKDNTIIGKFKVPILFFDPSNPEMIGVNDKNLQQIDILPSLVDYLKLDDNVVSFGKSFQSDKNFVVTYLDNVYNYINDDYYLAFDGKKTLGLYNWKTDPWMKKNLMESQKPMAQKMENFIKAYVQSFNERVSEDKLTIN